MGHFLELSEKYGKDGYYRLWRAFNAIPVIVICGPSAMKAILKTAGINAYLIELIFFTKAVISAVLITAELQ